MLANLDREVVGSPNVQILECKTAGEFGSRLVDEFYPAAQQSSDRECTARDPDASLRGRLADKVARLGDG